MAFFTSVFNWKLILFIVFLAFVCIYFPVKGDLSSGKRLLLSVTSCSMSSYEDPNIEADVATTDKAISLYKGETCKLKVTLFDQDNAISLDKSKKWHWNADQPAVVSITSDGELMALSPGVTSLSVKVDGLMSNRLVVIVAPATVQKMKIVAPTVKLEANNKVLYHASAFYSDGIIKDVTPLINWVVSDNNILSVDTNGEVITHKAGIATLSAIYDETISDTIRLVVT